MTDDERDLLRQTALKTDKIYRFLLDPSAADGVTFAARATAAVTLIERGNWAAKWISRGIIVMGAIVGALAVMWGQIRGFVR